MTFKEKVHTHCTHLVKERISLAQKLIVEAQTAANQDAKSSMGDKYETSREMMALEMRKASEQLQEASKLKKVLGELKPEKVYSTIVLGSLITTSMGVFYLAVSLGKMEVENKEVFVLSAVAPLGKLLLGKSIGDHFDFNSQHISIIDVA